MQRLLTRTFTSTNTSAATSQILPSITCPLLSTRSFFTSSSHLSSDAAPAAASSSSSSSSSPSVSAFAPSSTRPAPLRRFIRVRKPVSPLLSRVWGRRDRGGVSSAYLSAEDWANLVTVNRQRLLQIKEREQYRAWKKFQKMKNSRLDWMKANGHSVSAEMEERIRKREEDIMTITVEARRNITAPIPPVPSSDRRPSQIPMSDRGIKESARAQSHPQKFLRTQFENQPWRVFTFRLMHYHSHVLHKQIEKFRELAQKLGLSPSFPTYLPRRISKFTIIRGPHVDKTSREQYETRFYSAKIRIAPSLDKFYAIQRLSEIAFKLIHGNIVMRVETPPNQPIETIAFAPNPTKAEMGHTPIQKYAVQDSPGIEAIHYKFDQHQFPFLKDWEEEILDEHYRGIFPRDQTDEFLLPRQADLIAKKTKQQGDDMEAGEEEFEQDMEVFDERGEFSMRDEMEQELVGDDESEEIIVNQDFNEEDVLERQYEQQVKPLVPRKRGFE